MLWLLNRSGHAEDRVDFSLGYYLEDHNRVEVWSPVLLWEADFNKSSVIRVQAVYDVVSGASPTGAPPARRTKEVTTTVYSTSYDVVGGPSGTTTQVRRVTSTKQTALVPYGKPILPLHEFEDRRLGLNLELEHRLEDWILSGSVAYGTESDYESLAGTIKVGREFNSKTTLINAGLSVGHDWVLHPALDRWDGKDSIEGLMSLVQVINPTTLLTVSGSLGSASGYLDDQYKYASVDDVLMPEHRPDQRDRRVGYVMLNKMIEPLHGSLEATYRLYNDSFGVTANTYGLTWFQKLGKNWILAPSVRYYEQSAADFYAPLFSGKPEFYSADYRLAKLSTLTYGLKVIWKPGDRVEMSLGYDRYTMKGRDGGATSPDAFPSANIITAGVKVWF
ncbi:MAG: DUF3570 domain-containing protein [Verrucomicrobiaceae bacterium]|nr:DUF3570 domain-containing protein [Verrucomicrobiaceae bacterium]